MAAASYPDQQHFHIQHSSPLDTLVRKTSTRKPNNLSSHEQIQAAREQRRYPQGLPQLNTTERQPYQVHHAAPSSPLLHSHFNRQSNATWASSNDNSSYLDLSRDENHNVVQEVEYGYGNDYDMSSPETDHASSPALRDSWQSSGDAHTIRPVEDGDWPAVPTVMISEPEQMGYRAGKTPIIRPTTANFSRPARSAVEVPMEWENEQKQRVLERNASRRTLLRRPPSLRSGSPVSLYSTYSFYQLDSATPSPTDKQFQTNGPSQPSPKHIKFANVGPVPPAVASPLSASHTSAAPAMHTALEFLQLGITHHEADRLAESAVCFERAATLDGGCGVGMLMWGLALRHGWGCTKNEKHGFKWLRRAAESAVSDLEAARKGGEIDQGAVQTELVLAIYEVGQCFFHGWGIPKDQKMGVSYYAVAARMGDADAQMDLAFCLANGKGTKKDRKEAAKWYRDAVKQGQSDIGLAWIYKEKFQ
ncbi:hypothetical protein C8F04DRAFT_1039260 [Mycena alexandri]|uniref:HCP-like protein n=1 Tax=Mycena alexandri TaxID=1745969 RepID=A0AAD6SW05_9AGAR|nr:hypothetical protein C8F04DRAFT_1039260 [Mycena alexandri]